MILGSACTNDGRPPGKESFVAPSLEGQVAAIERALADAAVSPASIGYVEAHGTGTRLGDPVEVAALTDVYRRATSRTGYCSLGSVKANVGHLRTAAGVASLIKACLALKRRTRPPLANFARPNPRVDFEASPFVVHADARDWPADAEPRRAAVSSFGFGGANAHLVLEEHTPPARTASRRRIHLLPLSARTPAALARRVEELAAHVDRQPASAADVEHTLLHGRAAWSHRACYLVDEERVDAAAFARRAPAARGLAPPVPAAAVFLFPGQGAQRVGAGRELYAHEPVYRDVVDRCARTLEPLLGRDLRALMGYGDAPAAEGAAESLRMTAHAQPALFVVAYAGARLLMDWGVRPAALLGHSLGEIVAACLAGVFSLDDALAIVAARGRLMQACEPGAMAAVFAPAALIAERLPGRTRDRGHQRAVDHRRLGPGRRDRSATAPRRRGTASRTQRIDTSHAFHSRAMAAGARRVRADLRRRRAPRADAAGAVERDRPSARRRAGDRSALLGRPHPPAGALLRRRAPPPVAAAPGLRGTGSGHDAERPRATPRRRRARLPAARRRARRRARGPRGARGARRPVVRGGRPRARRRRSGRCASGDGRASDLPVRAPPALDRRRAGVAIRVPTACCTSADTPTRRSPLPGPVDASRPWFVVGARGELVVAAARPARRRRRRRDRRGARRRLRARGRRVVPAAAVVAHGLAGVVRRARRAGAARDPRDRARRAQWPAQRRARLRRVPRRRPPRAGSARAGCVRPGLRRGPRGAGRRRSRRAAARRGRGALRRARRRCSARAA